MHGLKDELIPPKHSMELNKVCPTFSHLHLVQNMDHNEFKLKEDLVVPFRKFVNQVDQQLKVAEFKRKVDMKHNPD